MIRLHSSISVAYFFFANTCSLRLKRFHILVFLFLGLNACSLIQPLSAQPSIYGEEPLAHTFSIVARDTITGEMGVAVQSHWFSVGTIVSWGEAGVGVVATQSFVNPAFGPQGLSLMKTGLTAEQSLSAVIRSDDGRDYRQVAMLDAQGGVSVYTGQKCIAEAGHRLGKNYAVQANMMANEQVWPAMAKAFEKTSGPLAERMLAALEAAQAVGGDIRGQQSAALLVVRGKSTGKAWEDRVVDLQVADHPTPITELGRLLRVHRAYEHMNQGDLAMEAGDVTQALWEYSAAEKMFPQNEEMKFWHAVSLVNADRVAEAVPLFQQVFAQNSDWKTLTPRLVPVGLLNIKEEDLSMIMNLD